MRATLFLFFTYLLLSPVYADTTDPLAAASAALTSGDTATAVQIATSAIGGGKLSKTDAAEFYAIRGRAYLATKAYDKAQSDLSVAIAAFADSTEVCTSLGDVFASRSEVYVHLRLFRDAYNDANAAIVCEPTSPIAQFDLGQADFTLLDERGAVTAFTAAIALKLDYTEAFAERGKAYENLGQRDKAVADYDEVIRLDPADWGAYNNRATIYVRESKFDEAIADLNKSIDLHSTNFLSFVNRGNAYYRKGDFTSAQADLDTARKLDADPKLHEAFEKEAGPAFTKQSEAQMDYLADFLANRPKQ